MIRRNVQTFIIGSNLDAEPIYTNGRVYFNFTGGICNTKTNESYTLLIITTCDYSSHTQNPIVFMPYVIFFGFKNRFFLCRFTAVLNFLFLFFHFVCLFTQSDDQCTFVLMWKSRSVCHPLTGPLNSNRCIAKDPQNNHEFNLMPLSDYNHKVTFNRSVEFLINICKPTLYGHNEMCPPHSSICWDNTAAVDVKDRFKNYGTTVTEPTFENGKLFMKFTSQEKCTNSGQNITSIINFVCDETIQVI